MSQGEILAVFKDAMVVVLKLSAPMLLISIIVGLVVAIFQAATQIHEQTLTFVPKLLAIALILLLAGTWMMGVMVEFTQHLYALMATL